ncbi:MAG: hypothetical protein L0Y60_17815, partial [Beijerinckiaceae bacterium]|nr:hypothetical protein [Beijerinckiaceae bacterium]
MLRDRYEKHASDCNFPVENSRKLAARSASDDKVLQSELVPGWPSAPLVALGSMRYLPPRRAKRRFAVYHRVIAFRGASADPAAMDRHCLIRDRKTGLVPLLTRQHSVFISASASPLVTVAPGNTFLYKGANSRAQDGRSRGRAAKANRRTWRRA